MTDNSNKFISNLLDQKENMMDDQQMYNAIIATMM